MKADAGAYPYASQPQPLYPVAPAAPLHPVKFRQSAHDKVAMPALLLQVWGGVLLAIGLLFMVMAGTAPLHSRSDMLLAIVGPGMFATAYVGVGSFLVYGGYCLRQLRFRGHVMAAVFFGLMTNLILCQPLVLLAIWPLIVVFDPEIKQAFELAKTEPPR